MKNNNDDNNNKKGNNSDSTAEQIKDFGSITSFGGRHKIFCLTIIGEIEGHSVLPEQSKTTK